MREWGRRANELSIPAALALAAAVSMLTARLGPGPAIEPMTASASGDVAPLAPPRPRLLQGEFRGPTAEEAADMIERRYRHEQSASRWLRSSTPGWVGTGTFPGPTR
jgi:hypothetical protein